MRSKSFRAYRHVYGKQCLNYCFLKYINPLVLVVARGVIEPPTHEISVRFKLFSLTTNGLYKLLLTLE